MTEVSFRALPSVDRVLHTEEVRNLLRRFDREPVVAMVRAVLDASRRSIAAGMPVPDLDRVAAEVSARALAEWTPAPRPVINATGVILHTNLGRAPLSAAAVRAMTQAAAGYSDLEYDLGTGERGSRQRATETLLRSLLGAEASHVACNAAAALTLALAALARGKEVIVSRGQSVEIGGGFRVPVVLRQSGARLVEVGTTNRTRLSDYEEAISPHTAAILAVHTSNFRIQGFTESVALGPLASLARRHDLTFIVDNGSGPLLDTAAFGLDHEPMPREALEAGAHLVAFSGDKLLGGPQAGIVVGEAALVRRVSRHPLARAMRPDKLVLAGLTATLLAYIRGEAETSIPIWMMIAQAPDGLAARAAAWRSAAARFNLPLQLTPGESTVGGGSLPGETLPTTLAVLPPAVRARHLRNAPTPVVARTHGGRVLLDPRTVLPAEDESLIDSLHHVSRSAQ